MSELINGIINATKLLNQEVKCLVISFHSIEDKIVKYFFSSYSENKSKPSRYLPENNNNKILFEKIYNKIIKPSKDEIFKKIMHLDQQN